MNQVAPSTRKLMKQAEGALQKQRAQEAFDLFQNVIALNPHHAEALKKCGAIMHSAGNYAAASDFYQRAILADPEHIESYLLMANLLETQRRYLDALQMAEQATRIAPDDPRTHTELASLMLRLHNSHQVPAYLETILPRFPNDRELHQFYCLALKVNNRFEEASAAYEKLKRTMRVPASFRVTYETMLPRLNLSAEQIDRVRSEFKASLERFIEEKPKVGSTFISANSIFFLAFHNRDNKELTRLYTRMLRQVAPELNYTAAHCKAVPVKTHHPVRIGFISSFMHNHSVGNCYRGAMLHLAKQPEFSVTFFNLADVMDEKIQEIIDAGVPIVSLPRNVSAAQEAVASYALDLIIYPDIGMNPATHFLAMARLAPYQACFQGHPETTGIDTIDYVISSRSYEPPHADENYTERLLCNDGIDTVFKRPTVPERWMTRAELGLPEDKKLYVCPMAIQKFHPDFDGVLAKLLASDPNATLVLFKDYDQQAASDMLQQRILSQCDPNRVIFLNWQPLQNLFSILKTADAILDTIYFGGGTTAQYAFGFGQPIVTMPGHHAHGRVVHSYYHIMGITNPPEAATLEEYVALAVRLANDSAYKEALIEEILQKNQRMFEQGEYGPHLVQLVKDVIAQDLDKYKR